ncbi:heme lyase CcmF/NrfE family subunit [Marivibrio halodurans]|uniref:Heme lyase CcmF/NrfE family subunit n=1 Tax=Marivibrio halodurans TaxID=2039722 RepID=A0A8J7V4U5_9PROT|nr:heme lyase CcmF/NrfE family subunit [Marivibrio halodurans]MBP5858064.1 heme lyase CcmF/NrfE family subunit [Marivibrio halodurans]
MIAELGHFALALAAAVALVQAVVPMLGAARGDGAMMAAAAPAALVQFGVLGIAFAALMHAYITSDFSVLNVIENSHSLKPLLYKVAGTWGNHEGSLLLWVTVLALFGALVAVFGRNLPPSLKARTLSVQALITLGFLVFMLLTSNPFARVFPPPIEGTDLNPLLQDPGLAFHPPMLYVGYVGLSISFSFAVAALIEGKVDAAWARWVRPWTLLAWTFLTAGIALGSWWAYYELGWGGFWYWDPVENASFMPWLAATALLHSAIVVEKRDTLKSWTILLAIIAFGLSLIGTFLVRSGVLTSVHAFASDPDRGIFILLLLVVAIGGSLGLYAWRAPGLQGGGLFRPVSREGALVLNNLLLSAAAATVFVGTLYPLFLEVLTDDKISVGPPYFNLTFTPIMGVLVIALGVGAMLPWKRGDLGAVTRRLTVACVVTAVLMGLAALLYWQRSALAVAGLGMAAWLAAATLTQLWQRVRPTARIGVGEGVRRMAGLPRAAWGMTLAHLGVAVIVAGATGASLLTQETISSGGPGDRFTVGDYAFTLESVDRVAGPNYAAERGTFRVTDAETGDEIATLHGERRRYVAGGQETTEAGIRSDLGGDLYAVLGQPTDDGGWTVRLYRKPLVPWLWIGSGLLVLGGLFSLSDRRLRVGAPRRSGTRAGGVARTQPAE